MKLQNATRALPLLAFPLLFACVPPAKPDSMGRAGSVEAAPVASVADEDGEGGNVQASEVSSPTADCRRVDAVKQECTYKKVGSLGLVLDVYRKSGADVRPVILWLHGGALIFGNRSELPAAQRNRYLDRGYAVVSVDYRLAPETKLDQIHADVADAYAWLRKNAGALSVDGDRIGVVGHSAGGYLTLTAGARLSPRPKAVVAFYGYGDIRWYASPGKMDDEELTCPADPLTGYPAGAPVAHTGFENTSGASSYSPVACGKDEKSSDDDDDNGDDGGDGGEDERLNTYACSRAKGYWPEVVGGRRLATDAAFFEQFEARPQVTHDYPPTMLLHGPTDDDVPFAQSKAMATALRDAHVDVELLSAKRWFHGFDEEWCDPSVQCAFDRVTSFLDRHLRGTGGAAPATAATLPDTSCDVAN